ncbi:MAG: DMT family transporter [Betaproteobacteria bacterium]|nr:DMT family transporter [Betaproteobacteria bacterium]
MPFNSPALAAVAPYLFVLLWSTGFIAAKFGLPHAEPLTFLAYRFLILVPLTAAFCLALRSAWPRQARIYGHLMVSGLLLHGVYLGGVFASIREGLGAGVVALIVGGQPLLTVLLARWWLRETVVLRQWLGLVVGLIGVYGVLADRVALGLGTQAGLPWAILALLGISLGTLYQKKHCGGVDLPVSTFVQYSTCALLFTITAPLVGSMAAQWTPAFIGALFWLVVVLSLGAIGLLYFLLRAGAASDVARFFYLVPAVTAILAFLMFGEQLGVPAILGMLAIAAGVVLARPAAPVPVAGAPLAKAGRSA